MAKTLLGVHLCPRKLYWELGQLPKFAGLNQNWWEKPEILVECLHILKSHGIDFVRLTIYNTELTDYPQTINFKPLDLFIGIAKRLDLKIDFCLGPYQYPLYPGIRLPASLREGLKSTKLDDKKSVTDFGRWLISEQLKRYGKNRTIRAFYLGNEWHTGQRIEDGDKKQYLVSEKHMQSLARLCKKNTKKPIIFNTNYDVVQCKKIQHQFLPLFSVLKQQACLGLDIYPSRIHPLKTPQIWFNRYRQKFSEAVATLKSQFSDQVIISEFEAQPWGDGKDWYTQIQKSKAGNEQIVKTLKKTVADYQLFKNFPVVTLWSAEYWLVNYYLDDEKLLIAVNKLSN